MPYIREIKAALIALVVLALFFAGWTVKGWREEAKRAKEIAAAIEAYKKEQADAAKVDARTAKTIIKVKKVYVEIIRDAASANTCDDSYLRVFNNSARAFNETIGDTNAAVPVDDGSANAQ